jgi:hypothetical protein
MVSPRWSIMNCTVPCSPTTAVCLGTELLVFEVLCGFALDLLHRFAFTAAVMGGKPVQSGAEAFTTRVLVRRTSTVPLAADLADVGLMCRTSGGSGSCAAGTSGHRQWDMANSTMNMHIRTTMSMVGGHPAPIRDCVPRVRSGVLLATSCP